VAARDVRHHDAATPSATPLVPVRGRGRGGTNVPSAAADGDTGAQSRRPVGPAGPPAKRAGPDHLPDGRALPDELWRSCRFSTSRAT